MNARLIAIAVAAVLLSNVGIALHYRASSPKRAPKLPPRVPSTPVI